MTNRRILLGGGLVAAAGAAVAAAFLLGQDDDRDRPVPTRVEARGFRFPAEPVKAKPGVPVEFTNADTAPHSFTADNGLFHSGSVPPGGRYSHTFSSPGRVAYHCEIHPTMRGVIEVEAAP